MEDLKLRSLDLFSCVGCHSLGFASASIETVAFVEKDAYRQNVLRRNFPEIPVHDDVTSLAVNAGEAEIVVGGPPCQQTSVAAAIHGRRSGNSLWNEMLRIGLELGAEWFVVEQPPGNRAWETQVAADLSGYGFHVSRVEFAACDLGAPYIRRRVFVLASTSLSRLEIAWKAVPRQIERVARSAHARGSWNADRLATLRVDAQSAGELDRGRSLNRRKRIEALGDSNPPEMMEVIGHAIVQAHHFEMRPC
ncbi:DNA cytosine methyltransferase [Gluconacetobacter azotocaptans]|uniref:DNA cytosine methyltransferase n=1 Tax=Gluconacetobacter azotocaptans TaxID=142834 RepID=UPI00195B019B|nr:DNA cytosine methyltransferase [Gluconacetobacter azotocaptans]MBM9400345.1 DNA cytosine methyltransferase [Gluconacetobacter azotocaptans]